MLNVSLIPTTIQYCTWLILHTTLCQKLEAYTIYKLDQLFFRIHRDFTKCLKITIRAKCSHVAPNFLHSFHNSQLPRCHGYKKPKSSLLYATTWAPSSSAVDRSLGSISILVIISIIYAFIA